jgi:hypothetical protein
MPDSTAITNEILQGLSERVTRLEAITTGLNNEMHVIDKEVIGMKKDLSYLREASDKQTSGINKILWAIGITFLGYFMSFVMSGGLQIGGL